MSRSPWYPGGGGTVSGTVNVQDNLNPSALNAPSANAVNSALAGKATTAEVAAAAANFGAGAANDSNTRAVDVPGTAKQAINVNRYIGFSNAFAAAMEALSEAMPKNLRVTTPNSAEQGTVVIPEGAGDLERTLAINVSGAAVSKHGFRVIGQGPVSTVLRIPDTGSLVNFRASGSWEGIRLISDGGGKFEFVDLRNFGITSYATQGADGVTRLTDPVNLLNLEYLVNLTIDNVYLYNRNLAPRGTDQYSLRLRRCYNFWAGVLRMRNFPLPAGGPAINGSTQPAYGGTGVLIDDANAGVIEQLNAGSIHRMAHIKNASGVRIVNLAGEQIVQGVLFDAGARGNRVDGGRLEWYVVSNGQEALAPENYWAAKGTATTRDNFFRSAWSPSVPFVRGLVDESATQSNDFENDAARRGKSIRNLLLPSGWTNAAGMTSTSDARIPPGKPVDSSTKLTSNGSYNVDRYQSVAINPDCGSVTAGVWVKRLTGDGFITAQIQSVINQPVFRGRLVDTDERFQTISTIPLATSGHSWSAANGGELTLVCQRPPYVQAGMRLVSGGIYGSGGGQVPNATSLPVRRVSGNNVIVGWASDPSTITAPAALTIPSDMNTWQGVADVTTGWVYLLAAIPIRYNVVAISLNGSNQPVATVSSGEPPASGAQIVLSGFADSRLNGLTHTLTAPDIAGNALTLSSQTVSGGALDTSNATADSSIAHKGYLGLASLRYSLRTVTSFGTAFEWLAAGETLVAGAHTTLMLTGDQAPAGGSSSWGGITGTLSAQADLQAALDARLPKAPTVIVLAGTTLTLGATHSGAIIRCTNAAATTITMSAAFSGMTCTAEQAGAGAVSFADGGLTLNGALTLSGQGAIAALVPADAATPNTWRVAGQVGTPPIAPGVPRAITGAATLGASDINTTLRFNSATTAALTLDTDAALGITAEKIGNSAIVVFVQGVGVPTFAAGGATILGTPRSGLAQNDLIVLNHAGIANTWSYA